MHWENSGTYVKSGSIEAALQNCIDYPGKYAFPIVSMMPSRQHYVLVTGVTRDEEGKITDYMVMNPENQTKDMMKYEDLPSTQIIQYLHPEAQ
jgi:hypothetical protein